MRARAESLRRDRRRRTVWESRTASIPVRVCRRPRARALLPAARSIRRRARVSPTILKHHSLPLVGAQVVTSTSGGKQVILFGFVASDFGKTDAEQKARHYLEGSVAGGGQPDQDQSRTGRRRPAPARPSTEFRPATQCRPTAPIRTPPPARSRIIRTTSRPARRPTRPRASNSSISSTSIQQRPAEHADRRFCRCCSAAA